MADYYPLIAKAVAGLDKNTGDGRRALYERARTALVTQLRGVSPALGESDITRERLALEEAIRKVEADAARKTKADAPPEQRRPERELEDQARAARGRESPPPSAPPEGRPPPPLSDQPMSTTAAELRRSRGKAGSLSDEGLRGFRDVVAEAENLGGATMQAGRAAREQFNAVPSSNPAERMEPRMETEGLRPRERRPNDPVPAARPAPPRRDPRPDMPPPPPARESRAESLRPAMPPRRDPPPPPAPDFEMPATTEPTMMRDEDFPPPGYGRDEAFGGEPPSGRPPRGGPRFRDEPSSREPRVASNSRRYIVMTILLLLFAGIAGVVGWEWQSLSDLAGSMFAAKSPSPTVPVKDAAAGSKKIPDRVGSDQRASSAAPAVAQRVVLYEEDPADPAGKRYVGSAVWRTETVSPGPDQPPEMVVRADIEIPERKMTMRWSLRRNTDKALPASHTVEIMFTLPPDFPNQGIQNIPGILMKQAEQTRGVPLAGLAVKVTTNFFLIGLSSVDADMQRNIQILKERSWFDIPVVYNNGRRAILAVEKGTPGEKAFAEAFAAWKQ